MPKQHEADRESDRERCAEMGRRIRAARIKAGYTTALDFASAIGVTPATLSGWEHGKHFPSVANLNRIADLTKESTGSGDLAHSAAPAHLSEFT